MNALNTNYHYKSQLLSKLNIKEMDLAKVLILLIC